MKLLYIHIEEDYKHIQAGGYYFDREFNVIKFNSIYNERKIELETNLNYHNPFNDNLNNISCIVGKNGVGKTTFFELIIAPLLWRLDGSTLEGKIHLLYYDEIDKEFYIQSYTQQANNWKLYLDKNKKNIYKNKKNNSSKIDVENNSVYRSVLPYQLNIIFHSLSPFDRIYDLLKLQLSSASGGQVNHYHKRLKYIGIKQIGNNETRYEYMTLINLISILLDEKSKTMFDNLGYEYGDIEINVQNEDFDLYIDIPEFSKFKKEHKKIIELYFTEESYEEFENELSFSLSADIIDESFFEELLLKNIKIDSTKNFINLIGIILQKYDDQVSSENIAELIYEYINNVNSLVEIKKICTQASYVFLEEIFENKEDLLNISKFNDNEYLKLIINDPLFLKLLKFIKRLANKNLISFKMNLFKDGESFDYFRLSSGEKTLLSYFANIIGRIRELDEIQSEDYIYRNMQNKSYLILIDEVELHLHPEWQRNFIKQLNEFFTYRDNTKKFQFVIASHSPFVVTDIYDDNIVYLGDNNPNTKTFGGNIFDIFKDDFYVSNTIGSFSEELIKDLSEVIYILFACKKAKKEENFFMIREYFDLMYETDDKEEENKKLLKELVEFLKTKNNITFSKLSKNKFIPLTENSFKEFENIKNNIGEPVIKEHIENMLNYIRESDA